jgi:hypothetical protein
LRYIKLYGDKEGRFPGEYRQLAEQTLMEDPRDAIQYAKWRGERWLEAEPVIAKAHPFHIYGYIRDVVGGAWEEGEPGLLSKPDENLDAALAYAEKYKGRWEDLERLLLERGKGQHIVDYANKVLDGRWEEAEDNIFASPAAPRYIKNLLAEKRNMDMSAIAREAMALAERKDNTKSFVELLEELQAAHEAKEAQKSARPPVDVNEIAEKAIAGLSKMSADDAQEVAESLRKVLPEQYHDKLNVYG